MKHNAPDRWVTIVTGEVTYVGAEKLLDGRTAWAKDEMKAVQATRFDLKSRAVTHRKTELQRRVFKEFWCLHLGEKPSFLVEGARVTALIELNRHYLGEGCTSWDRAYLVRAISAADEPLSEYGPKTLLDMLARQLVRVGA